jgi:hypothetical protein
MQSCVISADALGRIFETFLAESPQAVAIENGEPLFDFATARYSVSGEGKWKNVTPSAACSTPN